MTAKKRLRNTSVGGSLVYIYNIQSHKDSVIPQWVTNRGRSIYTTESHKI